MAISLSATACHGSDTTPAITADPTADSLGKSMAQLFLVKEENVPGAKHSMNIFQVTEILAMNRCQATKTSGPCKRRE